MTDSQAAQSTDRATSHHLFWLVVAIGVIVVVVDQLTKWWAVNTLANGSTVNVVGDLITFRLVYNAGAAFSTGTGFTWVFTVVSGVAAVVIAIVAWRAGSRRWALGLGLVFGGATTHFGDRLFRAPGFGRGHVVDFIDYKWLFIGNVADIAIVSGMCLLLVLILLGVRLGGRAAIAGGAPGSVSTPDK
jgi:signal peptidase II